MYLTNQQLVKELAKGNPDTVINKLRIIHKLLLRFGKKLAREWVIKEINNSDEWVANMITLLHKSGKLTTSTIKDLLLLIKSHYSYQKSFTVYSTKEEKDLDAHVRKNFDAHVQHKKYEKTWIRVEWEWLYYERNVDKDLKNLLG